MTRIEDHNPHHGTAALIAAAGSVLLHALLIYWFGDLPLNVIPDRTQQQARAERRRDTAMRVEPLGTDPQTATPRETAHPPVERQTALAAALREVFAIAPDTVTLTPPAFTRDVFEGLGANLRSPDQPPAPTEWHPRQIIQEITQRRIPDALATLPRREIDRVERMPQAPDYVPPFDLRRQRFSGPSAPPTIAPAAVAETLVPEPFGINGDLGDRTTEIEPPSPPSPDGDAYVIEDDPLPPYQAVEEYLILSADAFRRGPEADRVYFRLLIDRRDDAVLPVSPKDIVFVQDASASLAEERLRFCRQALTSALTRLRPKDRFNLIVFRDEVELLFPNWVPANENHFGIARDFIAGMRSFGSTDLYGSMLELLRLQRDPERPLIALVITDGHPTTGLTESTDIIGAFTQQNDGAISVYTVGTHQGANTYLLDLLSYCNRGDTTMVQGGRWGLPDAILGALDRIGRPVLDNVRFRFDAASGAEVYPDQSANLYTDRPLVLYGSIPAQTDRLVFQVRGSSGGQLYDMLFDIDLDDVPESVNGDELRSFWARQKLYALIGKYAHSRDRQLLAEMRRVSRRYRLPIPYADDL